MDRSGPSQTAKPRKELNWWHSFNTWWRDEYDKLGRRPKMQEVDDWYHEHAERIWGAEKPSLEATRDHAKCLRSKKELREYFQRYNAKKQLGRPFTDLRQMRGGRQRSGSQQAGTSTQSPGSNSDAGGCGGGGTSAGTSAGYGDCCDGSSGGGDASGGTPATHQTAASPQRPSNMESPVCMDTGNRSLGREADLDRGQDRKAEHLENGVAVGMPIILASSALAGGGSSRDARLLGPLNGVCASSSAHVPLPCGGAASGGLACGDRGGGDLPAYHTNCQVDEARCADASVKAACAAAADLRDNNKLTKQTGKLSGGQPQPSCNGSAACASAAPHLITAGAASGAKLVTNVQTGLHRAAFNVQQTTEPAMHTRRPQFHTNLGHGSTNGGMVVPGGVNVGGNSGARLEAAGATVDGHGSIATAEPYIGNTVLFTRFLAGLASNALGQRVCMEQQGLRQQVVVEGDEEDATRPLYDRSNPATAMAAALLDAKVQDPGRHRATERELVPSAAAAAALQPLQQQALLPCRTKTCGQDPGAVDEKSGAAATDNLTGRCGLGAAVTAVAMRQSLGAYEDATAAAPLPKYGLAGGYAAEGCSDAGRRVSSGDKRSGASYHDGKQDSQHQNQEASNRKSLPGAVDSAMQVLTCGGDSRAVGANGADVTNGHDDGDDGSISMVLDGGVLEPPTLELGEPSLSALLENPIAEAGEDEPTAGLRAGAHPPPLSCRSSGAFTGNFDESDVSGGSGGASVGIKRPAAAATLGLLCAPSLLVPHFEGVCDTPSLYRAPKLLRLDQVQQAAGRLNLTPRGHLATSNAAGHKQERGCPPSDSGAGAGTGKGGSGGTGTGMGPLAVPGGVGRVPSAVAGAACTGGPLPPGPPPDPFRTPMLLFQRSVGKEGLGSHLGGGGALPSAPSLLQARESVSTRGAAPPMLLQPRESVSTRSGMPPPAGLLPRESVGTAHVPPLLASRDSLETRLMPPPSLPLPERSSVVRSLPSNTTASQQQSIEHPQELLQRHLLRQQLVYKQHQDQQALQQHHAPQQHPATVLTGGLDNAVGAAAVTVTDKSGPQSRGPSPQPREDVGGNSKATAKQGSLVPPPGFGPASPTGFHHEAAPTLPSRQLLPPSTATGVQGHPPRSLSVLLDSGSVERVCLRQPLGDGRLLEAPLQVITVRLTLPPAALGALREAVQTPPLAHQLQ